MPPGALGANVELHVSKSSTAFSTAIPKNAKFSTTASVHMCEENSCILFLNSVPHTPSFRAWPSHGQPWSWHLAVCMAACSTSHWGSQRLSCRVGLHPPPSTRPPAMPFLPGHDFLCFFRGGLRCLQACREIIEAWIHRARGSAL